VMWTLKSVLKNFSSSLTLLANKLEFFCLWQPFLSNLKLACRVKAYLSGAPFTSFPL